MRPISSSNVQASPVLFPLHVLLLQVKYKIPKERMFHIKFFIRITPPITLKFSHLECALNQTRFWC